MVTAKHVLPLVGRNSCPVCLLAGEVDLEQDAWEISVADGTGPASVRGRLHAQPPSNSQPL